MLETKTLMIVEDETEFGNVLKDILESDFKEVYLVQNAIEALNIYKTKSPSIVLSDINLPRVNGLELAKEIKKLNQKQAILFMTAFYDKYDLNGLDYIPKPIKFDKLYTKLVKFFS